jgi:predicted RNA-binding protein YlxR (DUF448 family)
MTRIAVREDVVVIDEGPARAGRGGYLHRDETCLAAFVRSKVREFKSLRRRLALDDRQRLSAAIRRAAGQFETAGIR